MAVESAIESIHAASLHVNNLFELEPGLWRANLTDGKLYFSFADADSPEDALLLALAERGEGEPSYSSTLSQEEKRKAEDFADLFG